MDILTLPMFLEIIDSILNPKRGDEFFGKSADVRWNAYANFYTKKATWLMKKHCRVWQIINDETNNILYELITDDILHHYNRMIQEKLNGF